MAKVSLSIRHLAWICAGFAAGIMAMQFMPERSAVLAVAAVLCACILLGLFVGGLSRRRALLFAAALVLGGAYNWVWTASFTQPVLRLDGQTISCDARVIDYPDVYDDYTVLEMELDIEGTPEFTARLYDFNHALPPVSAGDTLSGSFSLRRGDMMHGQEYSGYLSRGVTMLAYPDSELKVTENTDIFTPPQAADLRH